LLGAEPGEPGDVVARRLAAPRDELVRIAYHDFSPAVPTTADGLAAGLIGFFAAWGGWRVVSIPARYARLAQAAVDVAPHCAAHFRLRAALRRPLRPPTAWRPV
jgi:hypothetical protein